MRPADIFALAVRLLGVWFFYLAVQGIATCFLSPLVFLHELAVCAAAIWCVMGAPPAQKWAYPDDKGTPSVSGTGSSPFGAPPKMCVRCAKPVPAEAHTCPHCGAPQPS